MSLAIQIAQKLANLTASGGMLTSCEGERKLSCRCQSGHAIAIELTELRLETPELAGCTADQLKRLSMEICNKLTYLMEPIAPIEVDQEQSVALLRSLPPQKNDAGRRYFEILVRREDGIRLTRYQKEQRRPRQVVPAHLTCELIERMVGDLESCLDDLR